MTKLKKILVLASGRGSNFQALIDSAKKGILRAEIAALGVSKKEAGALGIAEANGIPTLTCPTEDEILDFVRREDIDAVVLAGYLKIITSQLIEALRDTNGLSRIINVHPSLLPSFPGLNSYTQAFDAGVKETGVTIHLVEKGVDEGPILDQKSFRIDQLSSVEEVEARGLTIEHDLYPRTIDWFLKGEYRVITRNGGTYVARA
jgi:phosphoribosylglycinamide formyltransferase 1